MHGSLFWEQVQRYATAEAQYQQPSADPEQIHDEQMPSHAEMPFRHEWRERCSQAHRHFYMALARFCQEQHPAFLKCGVPMFRKREPWMRSSIASYSLLDPHLFSGLA